eukprot:TRINITY_DN149_c0_g1_i1.p1 TRINITY_DN149_c0_g1~~TRINITY_DN149_c0_g1_i1.p1  ORF type:complete len:220 (+),score=28.62 TRINITY_DN149_c0_g1_i1:149-808(+)
MQNWSTILPAVFEHLPFRLHFLLRTVCKQWCSILQSDVAPAPGLFVLDLDGTLIDASDDSPLAVPVVRPGAIQLVKMILTTFSCTAIWSHADDEWVDKILVALGQPRNVFYEVRTNRRRGVRMSSTMVGAGSVVIVKPLSKIWKTARARKQGISRRNTVILEDDFSNCVDSRGNVWLVPAWARSQQEDCVLVDLRQKVQKLAECMRYGLDVRFNTEWKQ